MISKAGTILVHTRCHYEGRYETRLMAASLWQSYDSKEASGDRRYTGRHWWGDTSGDVIEPLIGPAAEAMAARLGFSLFGATETGTSVIIVDPELGEKEPAEAAEYLAETIAWHLWPKMLSGAGTAPMKFSVTCDGISYPVPDPTVTRPLHHFVDAYRTMKSDRGSELFWRNKDLLGRFGLSSTITPRFEPTEVAKVAGFDEGLVHHVCLMRPAELVVTYWAGIKPPAEILAYAGVFRADESRDETYAKAEPPTHDSWNHQSLEKRDASYVRVTFTRLTEESRAAVALFGVGDVEVASVSLGAASERLSSLIGGAWGIGSATDYCRPGDTAAPAPRSRRNRRRSGGSPETSDSGGGDRGEGGSGYDEVERTPFPKVRRPRIEYVGSAYVDERWGHLVVVQEFRLPVRSVQRVTADLAVALSTDGGIEEDPPKGADSPGVVGWEDPSGHLYETPSYVIEGGGRDIWKVIVKPATDTMTDIALRTRAVEG